MGRTRPAPRFWRIPSLELPFQRLLSVYGSLPLSSGLPLSPLSYPTLFPTLASPFPLPLSSSSLRLHLSSQLMFSSQKSAGYGIQVTNVISSSYLGNVGGVDYLFQSTGTSAYLSTFAVSGNTLTLSFLKSVAYENVWMKNIKKS